MFIFDGHCDTITVLMERKEGLFDNDCHVSLKRLQCFDQAVQIFAIWLDDHLVRKGFGHTLAAIDFFKAQVNDNAQHIGIVTDISGILENEKTGKISAIIGVEGGEALEGKIDNLHQLYAVGVRVLTLLWNRRNALGHAVVKPNAKGLTNFGKQVVRDMNGLGMAIDVSHLSVQGFWDVAEISSKPFIASHSNCLSICGHPRNLSDEQLKMLAEKRGVAGVNLYPPFLNGGQTADISDVLRHIDHMLHVAGEDTVGLGSDFDGISTPPSGLDDVSCYRTLYGSLCQTYGDALTNKIFSGNFMRVLNEIL